MIAENFNFHKRNQASDQIISDFIAELRKLAMNCEFGDYLEEALRAALFADCVVKLLRNNSLLK